MDSGGTTLRLLERGDTALLRPALAAALHPWYPGSERWLERRLEECLVHRAGAHAHVAVDEGGVCATAIVAPKTTGVKISCIWVREDRRHHGIGKALLGRAVAPYPDRRIYATTPATIGSGVGAALETTGLRRTAVAPERYGPGRDEVVYTREQLADVPVRALSIGRPWAGLVARGAKDVENRSWRTTFRGLLVVHAPKSQDKEVAAFCTSRSLEAPRGAEPTGFAGVVRLVGIDRGASTCHGECSPWAMDAPRHWRLVDARPFDEAIPWRGQLNLWHPPPEVAARALELAAR